VQESRQYDADGRLTADVYAYAATATASYTTADGTFSLPIGGWLVSATTYYYNADGEVTATYDYGRDTSSPNYWNSIYNGTVNADQEAIPAAPPPLTTAPDGTLGAAEGAGYGVLTLQSDVVHWGPNGEAGYDAEGHALNYQYTRPNVETVAYQVQYLKQDGYLEASTTGTSPQLVKTTDTSYYDAFGRRVAIDTHSANSAIDDSVRAFAYDAEGQILERRDGSVGNNGAGTFSVTANGGYATQHYAYVGGQQIGSVDEAGDIDVLSGVTGFSNTDQGSSDYVAQAGDTMQSIAQTVYGDASLWYVVADANGFESATDAPAAGQALKLPEVQTNSNTAETFKPYNPHEISGSTTPALPTAPQPPPGAQGCNTLAEIVVIAVTVVVTALTYGATSELLESELGYVAGAAAAGVTAGVAGNLAGQVVGDAEGVHQGISLSEAADAGIINGVTMGVGAGLEEAGVTGMEAAAIEGASNYAGQVVAGKLTGEPAPFSWANLVADTVGSALTAKVGLPTKTQLSEGMGTGHFFTDLAGGLVDGGIDSETARLLGGDAANGRQIAEDAFGNALGNAAIAGIEHENAVSQRQEQSTASLLAADNPSSQVDPVAAFLSGPYANDFNDEAGLANYDPTQGPLLAAAGPMDVYEAVHGPVAPIDVTVPSFLANPSAGALDQLDYDAQWMSYARQMQQQGGAPDMASIQAAQAAYNAADDSDTAANGGQYDPAKVQALDAALGDMIEANGWSFGSEQSMSGGQVTTLPEITVTAAAPATGSSSSSYGMLSYATATSSTDDSGTLGDFATGFSLVGTAADVGYLASKSLGKPWGISIDWANPIGYGNVLINNGGKLPSWLAGPEIKNINIGADTGALHGADYVVDLSKMSKLTPWLERTGHTFGLLGLGIEATDALASHDPEKGVHTAVDAGAFFTSAAIGAAYGGPFGLAISVGWTVLDAAMSQYAYQGQRGWGAAAKEYGDTVNRVRQANPGFMVEKW
jgi:LysM repeat protein